MSKPHLTTEKFIEKSIKKHGNKYSYELVEYTNAHAKVKIICPIHGIFEQKANGHMNNGYGCIKCAEEQDSKSKRKDIQLFIEQANKTHNNKYDYSNVKYKNNSTKIEIMCNIHGLFLQTPDDHINSRAGCSKCAKIISKLEVDWLDYLQVPEQYRHAKIKIDGKTYKPDAYNPLTNTIYEFYGDFWHGNPQIYESNDINNASKKTFGELLSKTIEKENIIKKNGYNLITIWEKDWKLLRFNQG